MRTGPGQFAGPIRTGVLLSACLALVAATTGLLLTIHIGSARHSAGHDAHDCTVCQHLLTVSRKPLLAWSIEPVHAIPAVPVDTPEFTEHVEAPCLRISQPRGPPGSYRYQPV